MSLWLTIFAAGLLTYGIRLSFIYLTGRVAMPAWFMRALRFVPAAVLSAIIVPETLTWQGTTSVDWRNPQLWAAVVAVLVGLRVEERPGDHRRGDRRISPRQLAVGADLDKPRNHRKGRETTASDYRAARRGLA